MNLFITGIGTDVGKTIVSAVFTELFSADYWKPIQSGDLEASDSMTIEKLVSATRIIHPEVYRLKRAASPHQSAKEENITIKATDFQIPETKNNLIIEGAGGLFVPISDEEFVIDIISKFQIPVVLVARDYLGCINHTLLSLEILKAKKIEIAYFVFNGTFNNETELIIRKHLNADIKIISIPKINNLNKKEINKIASLIKQY